MNRIRGWRAAVLPSLIVFISVGLDRPALASAITSTWSGASASDTFDTQTQSQQGAMVNVSNGGSFTLNYEGSPAYPTPTYFQSTVSGNVGAMPAAVPLTSCR